MAALAPCPYGRASQCFPLSIEASAALAAASGSEDALVLEGIVAGHTTFKTRAAGAESVRLEFSIGASAPEPEEGAHLIAVRAHGREGWLPGLAGTRRPVERAPLAVEVVVFGRPDGKLASLMYLPESTLREWMPTGAAVELRFIRNLLPVQHDCPEQWLRDRLLRLANLVEDAYSKSHPRPPGDVLHALARAGLRLEGEAARCETVLPAKLSAAEQEEELGYWHEEAKLNTRCAGTMDDSHQSRLDELMSHMPG